MEYFCISKYFWNISAFLDIYGIFLDLLENSLADIFKIPWLKLSHLYLFTFIQHIVENMRNDELPKKLPGVYRVSKNEEPDGFTWGAQAILENTILDTASSMYW